MASGLGRWALTGFWALAAALALTGCGRAPAPAQEPPTVRTASGVAMVLLRGGTFRMGSDSGSGDEVPVHEVTISPLAMDRYEVTQDQYAALQMPNPSHFKDPKRPVEQVRWSDAALFCNERSRTEGLHPCYDEATFVCDFGASGYRLPTEAEWEYAARAGSTGAYYFGDDARQLKSHACNGENSGGETDLVGKKKPNRWGLCDLYGNVYEWCHDAYGPAYYAQSPAGDPRGSAEGEKRVLRGGAWNSGPEACRAAARYADAPGIHDACFARDTYGFRCVRRLTDEELGRLGNSGDAR